VTNDEACAHLKDLLAPLVGQSFRVKRSSYPDASVYEFGERRWYTHPSIKHVERGAYTLRQWDCDAADVNLVRGDVVTSVDVQVRDDVLGHGFVVTVRTSGGGEIVLSPHDVEIDADTGEPYDADHWTYHTPNAVYTIGPGLGVAVEVKDCE